MRLNFLYTTLFMFFAIHSNAATQTKPQGLQNYLSVFSRGDIHEISDLVLSNYSSWCFDFPHPRVVLSYHLSEYAMRVFHFLCPAESPIVERISRELFWKVRAPDQEPKCKLGGCQNEIAVAIVRKSRLRLPGQNMRLFFNYALHASTIAELQEVIQLFLLNQYEGLKSSNFPFTLDVPVNFPLASSPQLLEFYLTFQELGIMFNKIFSSDCESNLIPSYLKMVAAISVLKIRYKIESKHQGSFAAKYFENNFLMPLLFYNIRDELVGHGIYFWPSEIKKEAFYFLIHSKNQFVCSWLLYENWINFLKVAPASFYIEKFEEQKKPFGTEDCNKIFDQLSRHPGIHYRSHVSGWPLRARK